MSMITLPREELQQALDALKVAAPCHNPAGTLRQSIDNAINALHARLEQPVEQPEPVSRDMTVWCEYVAGMACGWLGMPVDDPKIKAVAGIIERRLWSMPQPTPVAQPVEQPTTMGAKKLASLQAQGYTPCGVMISRAGDDGNVKYGAVSDMGRVLWWTGEQTEQEPVATFEVRRSADGEQVSFDFTPSESAFALGAGKYRVYTAPPAAQPAAWVGLTDEEANDLWESTDENDSWELMMRVQAKLSEKNGGAA